MARQPKPEFNLDSILNNPVDSKTLKGFIDEAVLLKEQQKSASESIADIRAEAKDKLGIPPKEFNSFVKARVKNSVRDDLEKAEQSSYVLEKLYGVVEE